MDGDAWINSEAVNSRACQADVAMVHGVSLLILNLMYLKRNLISAYAMIVCRYVVQLDFDYGLLPALPSD